MTDQTGAVMSDRSRRRAEVLVATEFPIGSEVRLVGGFEDGLAGFVVGCRQRSQHGPYSSDYPVFYLLIGGELAGGWSVGNLEPVFADRCPYCGTGPCRGSARSTDGRDLEQFDYVHPRRRVRRVRDQATRTLLECHGCGAFGTYDVFGIPTCCPNCGSGEVHSFKPETALMRHELARLAG